MDFKTLEDVGTFMIINIRLSRYDLQFVNNLTNMIGVKNTITTNQDSLFKKIALKYRRQYVQQKFDIDTLLLLPWKCNVIESSPQYTNASISIIKDKIIFRSPFSKSFLTALKKKPIHSMEWLKDKRQYEISYGPTTLKELITMSADYFNTIDYCSITRQIIDSLSEYESVKYWEPTLVYNNGYFYVAACNQILYDTIQNIPLTNDLKMVADYVQYGIAISDSVIEYFSTIEDPRKVNLAVNFQSDFEIKELETAIKWLSELGCDGISESSRLSSNFKQLFLLGENSENLLNELEMDIIRDHSNLKSYDKPVMIHYRNYGAMNLPTTLFKMIKCVNSEPVNLGDK
jgi:hypothetical protein